MKAKRISSIQSCASIAIRTNRKITRPNFEFEYAIDAKQLILENWFDWMILFTVLDIDWYICMGHALDALFAAFAKPTNWIPMPLLPQFWLNSMSGVLSLSAICAELYVIRCVWQRNSGFSFSLICSSKAFILNKDNSMLIVWIKTIPKQVNWLHISSRQWQREQPNRSSNLNHSLESLHPDKLFVHIFGSSSSPCTGRRVPKQLSKIVSKSNWKTLNRIVLKMAEKYAKRRRRDENDLTKKKKTNATRPIVRLTIKTY